MNISKTLKAWLVGILCVTALTACENEKDETDTPNGNGDSQYAEAIIGSWRVTDAYVYDDPITEALGQVWTFDRNNRLTMQIGEMASTEVSYGLDGSVLTVTAGIDNQMQYNIADLTEVRLELVMDMEGMAPMHYIFTRVTSGGDDNPTDTTATFGLPQTSWIHTVVVDDITEFGMLSFLSNTQVKWIAGTIEGDQFNIAIIETYEYSYQNGQGAIFVSEDQTTTFSIAGDVLIHVIEGDPYEYTRYPAFYNPENGGGQGPVVPTDLANTISGTTWQGTSVMVNGTSHSTTATLTFGEAEARMTLSVYGETETVALTYTYANWTGTLTEAGEPEVMAFTVALSGNSYTLAIHSEYDDEDGHNTMDIQMNLQ